MQTIGIENQGSVLIVDDLADNLRVLSNTLAGYGYYVRAVKSGTMALMGAKASPPDVILLDIRMPETDGYEVCRQLKADVQTCEIPIIFLSALDEAEDKARAFAMGGADYITKPFQTEEVLARVKNQLTIQRLKSQVAEQQQQLSQMAALTSVLPQSGDRKTDPSAQNRAIAAIANILDYTSRLSQHPALDAEQYAALKIIDANTQVLLNLINPDQGSPLC